MTAKTNVDALPAGRPRRRTFPKTAEEALQWGYRFVRKGTCIRCKVELHMYLTPRHKMLPIVDPDDFTPHWRTCRMKPLPGDRVY